MGFDSDFGFRISDLFSSLGVSVVKLDYSWLYSNSTTLKSTTAAHRSPARGIDLCVEEGQIVALLGANGAGKSTTLRAISGLLKPSAGEILFAGKSIAGLEPHRIVELGIAHVPEGRGIFANFTVEENLAIGAFGRA